jgi:transposase-like protein
LRDRRERRRPRRKKKFGKLPSVKTAETRHPGGRPSRLTPALAAALVAQLDAGATLADAATSCGIGARTLRSWRRRAWSPRAADAPYVDLERRIIGALARSRPVEPAAMEWQDLAAVLEHEHPARWGSVEPELDDLLGELE